MDDDPAQATHVEDRDGSLLVLAPLALAAGAATGIVGALFRLSLEQADRLRDALITWAHGRPAAETFPQGVAVRFCPGAVGGEEWNSPASDPLTNLVLTGEVDWCDNVTPKEELRAVAIGKPWAGIANWNPFAMFGKFSRSDGHWTGWLYATDADTGVWKRRLKSNYPIVSGLTPTAGGVVFFGDVGGNFYVLDAATGEKLSGQNLGGAIGGGVITYTADGAQKVAVAVGFTHPVWPTQIVTAKIVVLGIERDSVKP
jgi:alcohol dehydrogenase (cytochrome c)